MLSLVVKVQTRPVTMAAGFAHLNMHGSYSIASSLTGLQLVTTSTAPSASPAPPYLTCDCLSLGSGCCRWPIASAVH